MVLGVDYEIGNAYMRSKYATRYNNSGLSSSSSNNMQLQQQQGDTFVGTVLGDVGSGNTCTDGKDDGKIGLLSAIGNIGQGIVRGATNMVKSAVTHPLETIAMVGACCIPVVGPFIAGGLCLYGIAKGGSEILGAIDAAGKATTDAEAKAAFENIGSGGLTFGLSAVGLKASAGALKGQLNGGSTTVNAVKEAAQREGATAGDIAEVAVREGINETASNAGKVVEATTKKVGELRDGAVDKYQQVKEQGLKETVKNDVSEIATKAGEKAKGVVDSASKKVSEIKTAREKAAISKKATSEFEAAIKENKIQTVEDANAWVERNSEYSMSDIDSSVAYKKLQQAADIKVGGGEVTESWSNGMAKEVSHTGKDGEVMVSHFDKKGNLQNIEYYSKEGAVTHKFGKNGTGSTEYIKPENGNIEYAKSKTKNGLFGTKETVTDTTLTSGSKTKGVVNDSTTTTKELFKTDRSGNIIRKETVTDKTTTRKRGDFSSIHHSKTKQITGKNGSIESNTEITNKNVDSEGKVINEVSMTSNENIVYDSNGKMTGVKKMGQIENWYKDGENILNPTDAQKTEIMEICKKNSAKKPTFTDNLPEGFDDSINSKIWKTSAVLLKNNN